MRSALFLLVIICNTAWADTVYFQENWCPSEKDLAAISEAGSPYMSGCCIFKIDLYPRGFDRLQPWKHRIVRATNEWIKDPLPDCTGQVQTAATEDAEKVAYKLQEAERVENDARLEKERREQERQRRELEAKQAEEDAANQEAARLKNAPEALKKMSKAQICAAYGNAKRGEVITGLWWDNPSLEAAKFVMKEAARRKLKFNNSIVSKQYIQIGISECQLYASWGLPQDQHRSVGPWGEHIQHVYSSGTYVYTQNGKVTSWQD